MLVGEKSVVRRFHDSKLSGLNDVRACVCARTKMRRWWCAISSMLQPRRRRLPLTTLDNDSICSEESAEGKSPNGKRRRRRKRKRRQPQNDAKLRSGGILVFALILTTIVALIWKFQSPLAINFTSLFERRLRNPSIHLEHRQLYDDIHRSANSTQVTIPLHEKKSFRLSSSYGSDVMKQGCNLTVVFMDPRLATAAVGEPAWYSLESVAAFLPRACILLQTGKSILESLPYARISVD